MVAQVGSYERKQLLSPSRIVRWSHGRRFELARGLVKSLGGRSLIDYGCGDGMFVKRVHELVDQCVASDVVPCDLSHIRGVPFVRVDELDERHAHRYDLVFCMEVLEHCVAEGVEAVLDDLRRLVAPGGAVVISVPIETGPTLLGKQTVRRVLGARKVGDYQWTERYGLLQLMKMVFARENTAIPRPVHSDGRLKWHTHFGFNWRALARSIERRFVVEDLRFTPLGWTREFASSQAWFVCRPR
jgi:SAM-dependent methyltransferase